MLLHQRVFEACDGSLEDCTVALHMDCTYFKCNDKLSCNPHEEQFLIESIQYS